MKCILNFIAASCFIVLPLLLCACNDEGQGEGRVANPLTPGQAAEMFFEAYRDFDKAAAERVSNREVVNMLEWDRSIPRSANLKLEGESIQDGDKFILLMILSDGHVGATISEIKITEG